MLASEALPLLTAKWAKNSDSHRQCIMQRAPRLKKRLKPVESAQPNLSIRTTGVCDGPL